MDSIAEFSFDWEILYTFFLHLFSLYYYAGAPLHHWNHTHIISICVLIFVQWYVWPRRFWVPSKQQQWWWCVDDDVASHSHVIVTFTYCCCRRDDDGNNNNNHNSNSNNNGIIILYNIGICVRQYETANRVLWYQIFN